MRKHNGIAVVAFLPGQPRSEVVAALEIAGLGDEFTTDVQFKRPGSDVGVACNVNLYEEAAGIVSDLDGAGISGVICQGEHGWEVA